MARTAPNSPQKPGAQATAPAQKAFLGLDSCFKLTLFVGYISLWISQGMLVYASRRDGKIKYNFTSVVLVTEFTKLLISTAMYLQADGSFSQMLTQVKLKIEDQYFAMIGSRIYL